MLVFSSQTLEGMLTVHSPLAPPACHWFFLLCLPSLLVTFPLSPLCGSGFVHLAHTTIHPLHASRTFFLTGKYDHNFPSFEFFKVPLAKGLAHLLLLSEEATHSFSLTYIYWAPTMHQRCRSRCWGYISEQSPCSHGASLPQLTNKISHICVCHTHMHRYIHI